uniref:J domain-containing protein n=1 Tax=Palpitomonas bilix TaxID=652834 RepID=A0A7S3GHD8_9EUKA|mmetsp:Transcript_4966/g.10663  ORF Transcript_4966/g.10663 Transcript_4966/m.10663 type:complete len:247 (+) Transcript_4966:401-1141(+)|eukprot:CAMPEP_0113880518 /NCGR_PEP_ID=MMETSP0780_2-20120614/7832_1 /TAXON_ID=652834 /ORGANISM="Palpitomonas bilix" /LENGTH=246 /DNA_ID=CAMNT_0000867207 /DNA_START=401 /DNA_END=1141 /DNA_ORIENTATION=+ /assembly_acc=CAM_ASM_000599
MHRGKRGSIPSLLEMQEELDELDESTEKSSILTSSEREALELRLKQLEEKQKLELEKSREQALSYALQKGEKNPESVAYVETLITQKPWLRGERIGLARRAVDDLKTRYPIEDDCPPPSQPELDFIKKEVWPKRLRPRESKSDEELYLDARYVASAAGKALLKRMQDKDPFDVLGLPSESTPHDAKRAFYRLALIFHPDAIFKNDRQSFLCRSEFVELSKKVFHAIEVSYKMVVDPTTRRALLAKR